MFIPLKNNCHLYDPQCRCHHCVNFELDLKDTIRSERNRPLPSMELSRPITDQSFKSSFKKLVPIK